MHQKRAQMSGSSAPEAPVGESPVWIKPTYVLNHTEPEVWISMVLQPKDELILTQGRSHVFVMPGYISSDQVTHFVC